jgi:DNA-binding transcriptional ArsR family regulator
MAETNANKLEFLMHPVRIRILQAFIGERRLSVQEVGEVLADVPPATLYRHLNALAQAGVLVIAEKRRRRGTIEKVYTLPPEMTQISQQDLAHASRADLMRALIGFLAGLIGSFARYLSRKEIDLERDMVGFRIVPLTLTDDELRDLLRQMDHLLIEASAKGPGPGRTPRTLTRIVLPDDATPAATEPAGEQSDEGVSST